MNIAIKLQDHQELLRITDVSHWNVIAGDLNAVRVEIVDGKEIGVVVGSFHTWEYVTEDNSDEMDD